MNRIEEIRTRLNIKNDRPSIEDNLYDEDVGFLLSILDQYMTALEWTKEQFDKEWTYEMGVGEVVEEIIQKFEKNSVGDGDNK
jgi:hypothetical protein